MNYKQAMKEIGVGFSFITVVMGIAYMAVHHTNIFEPLFVGVATIGISWALGIIILEVRE